jgi:uncharacterized damage-inducible protein DinB
LRDNHRIARHQEPPLNILQTLTRYKSWADELIFDNLSKLGEAELTAPQPIIFGSLLRTLNHVYAMDLVWQAHLTGHDHGMTTRNPRDCPPFDELRGLQEGIDAWWIEYADLLPADRHDEPVHFTFIGGGPAVMSRADIILHVVNHATYHRGHVADMLYRISRLPPTTDLPVYLKQSSAQPA